MRRFLKRGNFSPFSCHRDGPWPPKAAHTNHTCIRSDHLHLEVSHCTFCSLQNILSLHAISTWSPIVWTGVMTARGHGNTVEGSSPIKKAFRFINQQRQGKKITKSRYWLIPINSSPWIFFPFWLPKKKMFRGSNFFICLCNVFFDASLELLP